MLQRELDPTGRRVCGHCGRRFDPEVPFPKIDGEALPVHPAWCQLCVSVGVVRSGLVGVFPG